MREQKACWACPRCGETNWSGNVHVNAADCVEGLRHALALARAAPDPPRNEESAVTVEAGERDAQAALDERRETKRLMAAGYHWVWRFFSAGCDLADPAELKTFYEYCVDVEKFQ